MRVLRLSLTDFRNYASADVELAPGPNLFIGRNGQGKTNLVESLGYLATLGSHRTAIPAALIRQGCDSAIVRAQIDTGERELLLEAQLNRTSPNRAQLNRSAIKPRELPRYFSSVLFAPEDLALIRGEPSGRRRYLDELLVARNPRLAGVLGDYERVVRQRNSLLKSARQSRVRGDKLSTLEIWDERLVAFGSEIIAAREELVQLLRSPVAEAYAAVAGDDHAAVIATVLSIAGSNRVDDEVPLPDHDPVSAASIPELFRAALERLRASELDRGLTLVGPHRDDLFLSLNALPARGYASHGESWSFALALKLGAGTLLRSDSPTGDPVIILDDVFAELDRTRRERLADAVGDYSQVLITAAVEEDVPERLAAHIVRISQGTIVDGVVR